MTVTTDNSATLVNALAEIKQLKGINLYDCKPDCDISKAKNVARATWVCAKCGRDISLQYLLWYQSAYPEEWSTK